MIRQETLGLVMMPLILVKVSVPLLLVKTRRPLVFFARSYIPRLGLCLLIAVFVFFGSRLQSYPAIFYILLIVLLGLDDAFVYMQGAARGGFFAQISDTHIGGTYYTLLASLNNAGQAVSSSLVFYTAAWLPKEHAYYIEVGICLLLGCVWLCASWRLLHRLQALPVERWHVISYTHNVDVDQRHQQMMAMVDNKKEKLPTAAAAANMGCSSWL
jgi:PAT family acetyl-CoA transporter-like MFS transporter 1